MGIKYEFYEKLLFYPVILILLLDLKSTFFFFLIIRVWVCTHECPCLRRTEASDTPELESQAIVSCPVWMLAAEPGASSVRTVC